MRLLFLGDMVGKTGREAVFEQLPKLIKTLKTDFVIINGENAASGFGITEKIFLATLDAGADVVTSGNHAFDNKDALGFAPRQERFLRPANFPAGTPGKGANIYEAKSGARVMVANLMGQVFMHPELDSPFIMAEQLFDGVELGKDADVIFVDFHAEATSEKQCFGHFVDGKVTAVIGTHTHIPTADAQILNGGTAYCSDAGMCGDYDSSLGMQVNEPLHRFLHKTSSGRFEPAEGEATLCGVGIEIDDKTGLATHIAPLRLGPRLENQMPW